MTELNLLRKKINQIDEQLIELLEKRIEVSKEIGNLKKKKNIAIFDAEREKEIIEYYTKNSDNKEYIEKFLHTLMDISKEVQSK